MEGGFGVIDLTSYVRISFSIFFFFFFEILHNIIDDKIVVADVSLLGTTMVAAKSNMLSL